MAEGACAEDGDVAVVVKLPDLGPPPGAMGKSDPRQMLSAVRRLCGQPSMGPRDGASQSIVRMSAPVSP